VPPRRLVTLFLYLNNLPTEQGHTEFPALNISVAPQRGCGVLFSNVLSNGDIDPQTIHRAAPVHGNLKKYGVNVWLCDQSFQDLALDDSRGKKEKLADSMGSTGKFRRENKEIDGSAVSALVEAENLTEAYARRDGLQSSVEFEDDKMSTGKLQTHISKKKMATIKGRSSISNNRKKPRTVANKVTTVKSNTASVTKVTA
jgi:hypothetical protein